MLNLKDVEREWGWAGRDGGLCVGHQRTIDARLTVEKAHVKFPNLAIISYFASGQHDFGMAGPIKLPKSFVPTMHHPRLQHSFSQ